MHRRRHTVVSAAAALTCFALVSQSVRADYEVPNPAYAPPTTYYNSATGIGFTLRTNLHNIVTTGFHAINYGDARFAMGTGEGSTVGGLEDIDPNNSSNILLVYNRASILGQWDAGATWNREHVWPKSLLNLTSSQVSATYKGVASDAFELRPSNPDINSARLNYGYGFYPNVGSGAVTHYGITSDGLGNTFWYPGDPDRGEVARAIFYMATRWLNPSNSSRGTDNGNLELVNGPPSLYNFGDLNSLLHWNYLSGVDNFERRRNQYIYGANGNNVPTSASNINPYYQANRNPFIDHPEYVWAVYGSFANDSQLYVGASPGASGSTSTAINLRVMKNGAWTTTSTNLSRGGAAPTTYNLTASGSASTTAAGPGQGYDSSITAKSIPITLTASTATTGLKTGSIAVHNTDLTSSAAGHGSADGDDTITVNGQVVDNRIITASAVNFGRVIAGAAVTSATTLSSPGDDDHNTRVTVRGLVGSSDSNGVFITAGVDNVFNGTLTSANRTLQANFATAGSKSGSRAFTLQGEGLTGEAVGGVSVSYSATALDHSNASFTAPTDSNAMAIDFGYVPAGFVARTAPFTINNLASANGAALTAALDIDGVSEANAQMHTDVSPTQIAAGDSLGRTATFTPDTIDGDNSASHTISVSDENIPGASNGASLVLTTSGRTVTTGTFPVTGFINLLSGETYNATAFAIQSGVALTKTGPGAINVSGAQSHGSGATLLVNQGNVTFNSDAGGNLAVSASGATSTVNFDATQHLSSLSLANAAKASVGADGSRVLVTEGLDTAFIGGGQIDLSDNKLIVRNGQVGSFNGSTYTGVTGAIQSGRNGGSWDGNGIVTSQSAAASGGMTSLGIATAADVKGISGGDTASWAGETVSPSDVLVMYTYAGDATMDGEINVDDYGRIDFNSSLGTSGWANGDFNYDGKINVDDYGIIDFNVGIQGAAFPTGAGTAPLSAVSAVSAVPEPATSGLLAAACASLALRRRRR